MVSCATALDKVWLSESATWLRTEVKRSWESSSRRVAALSSVAARMASPPSDRTSWWTTVSTTSFSSLKRTVQLLNIRPRARWNILPESSTGASAPTSNALPVRVSWQTRVRWSLFEPPPGTCSCKDNSFNWVLEMLGWKKLTRQSRQVAFGIAVRPGCCVCTFGPFRGSFLELLSRSSADKEPSTLQVSEPN